MKNLAIGLIALVTFGCFALGQQLGRHRLVETTLAPDTTVLIVRVFNYQPGPVTVYVDALDQPRHRIGTVTPYHEAFFVLPSITIAWLQVFHVTVEPAIRTLKPYRTGPITRNPFKITMVFVVAGEDTTRARIPGLPQS